MDRGVPFQLLSCAPSVIPYIRIHTKGVFKVHVETRITRKLENAISEADCFISLRTKLKNKGQEKWVIDPGA